jgi:hypothetical protein
MNKRFLGYLASLLILTACAEQKMEPEGIEFGTYSEKRYVHPTGNFSIEIPKSYPRVVQESDSSSSYSVGFLHESGSLMKFEIRQIPKQIQADLDPLRAGEALKNLFNQCMLPKIKKRYPETQIMEDDVVLIEGCRQAYFVVLEVYFQHPLFSLGSFSKEDYIRGYLVYLCDNRLIVLSEHMAGSVSDAIEDKGRRDDIPEIMLRKLKQSQKLYRNEPPCEISLEEDIEV